MNVYTFAEARQRLSSMLDEAERKGAVRIRRRDGREFELLPVKAVQNSTSPFDVEGAGLDLTADEIVAAVRETRSREAS